jgi:hypothetical protein
MAFIPFQRKSVATPGFDIEALHVNERPGADLQMDMLIFALGKILEINIGERPSFLVCIRDQEIGKVERQKGKQDSGNEIRPEHPVITDPAAEDRNDLRIGSHMRGEIYDRNESKEITEQINEIWDEIEVIIEDDGI